MENTKPIEVTIKFTINSADDYTIYEDVYNQFIEKLDKYTKIKDITTIEREVSGEDN